MPLTQLQFVTWRLLPGISTRPWSISAPISSSTGSKTTPTLKKQRVDSVFLAFPKWLVSNCCVRSCQGHFIIRTSGLYGLTGSRVKRGNFVETMLRLGKQNGEVRVVNDLRMAQTSTWNLAKQVLSLVRSGNYGTYHASDHGDYSWYEFAKKIFDYSRMNVTVTPVSWRDMPSLAPRPRYSVLENRRLKKLGLDQMQPIDTALQVYLKARCGSSSESSQSGSPFRVQLSEVLNDGRS